MIYAYRAQVSRIVDGDTVDVDIDLGFNAWLHNERLRLYGVNAPEVRTRNLVEKARGKAATAWLVDQLAAGELLVRSVGFDAVGKFGRSLAVLFVNGVNVNQAMIEAGHAELNYYGKPVGGPLEKIGPIL